MIYFRYLNYILRHKWFVLVECFKVGLYWRGLTHDMSKLLPSEFFPYAHYFYGKDINDQLQEEFDTAWLVHQKRNKHHPQYWIRIEDSGNIIPMKMPNVYRLEMLCDWIGAGMAKVGKNDVVSWYDQNRKNVFLHEETREWIEKKIDHYRENMRS